MLGHSGKHVVTRTFSSSGPQGPVLPRIPGSLSPSPPEVTSDSPGIPVVRARIILVCGLEGELALCETFKDGLSSHLGFQLCKRTGEKSPQNERSRLGLVKTKKLIYIPNPTSKGKDP